MVESKLPITELEIPAAQLDKLVGLVLAGKKRATTVSWLTGRWRVGAKFAETFSVSSQWVLVSTPRW